MRPRLLNVLTLLSSLACLAVVALRVDCLFARHWIHGFYRLGAHEVVSEVLVHSDGVISLTCTRWQGSNPWYSAYGWAYARRSRWSSPFVEVNDFGFGFGRYLNNVPPVSLEITERVSFPWWCVAVVTAVLPAAGLRHRLRRQRPPGLCRHCGYDLRGTPDRCPECGTSGPGRTLPCSCGPGAAA